MRIIIDMQGAQTESRYRGIGRYTVAFAQAIARNRDEHDIVLALNGLFPDTIEPIRAAFDGLLPQENIRVWSAPGPVQERISGNEWRRETAEFIREAFLINLKPDVIHIPSLFEGYVDDAVTSIGRLNAEIPVSVTIHDLIPLLNTEHYLKPNPIYEKYYYRKISFLRRASLFLAISDSSRREAIEYLGLDQNLIINTSEGVAENFRPLSIDKLQSKLILEKLGIKYSFILYAGGSDERKNLPRLIKAYAQLPMGVRKLHQLVFAGRMPESDIDNLKYVARAVGLAQDELLFTGYVTDEELVYLYNVCELFIFPSWHEGFGLPALEAMACAAPVIGSNRSSLPEIIGRRDALFDPYDLNEMSQKMSRILVDKEFHRELKTHGVEQASKFSWDESASQAIKAFESLCGRRENAIKKSQIKLRAVGQVGSRSDVSMSELEKRLIQSIVTLDGAPEEENAWVNLAQAIAESVTPETPKKQLFVDVSELSQRDAKSGIQRVVRSMLIRLLDNPPEGYRVEPVYATLDSGYHYARRFTHKFIGHGGDIEVDEPIEFQCGDIFLGLDYQVHVVTQHRKFFNKLRRFGVQLFFVVHDLIPYRHPEWFYPEIKEEFDRWLHTISQGDGVLCVSRATADDFLSWLNDDKQKRLRPLKVGWFHNGADIEGSAPTNGYPEGYEDHLEAYRERPTFLVVGTLEPRKGHAQILAAFEILWDAGVDVNLVIVGKQGWEVDGLVKRLHEHRELGKRLFWLEAISDEYLKLLYNESSVLIAASHAEGFGLPLIEAAKNKLPIIARDIPVFREVAGNHAYYFSGNEPRALADAIKEWLALHVEGNIPLSEKIDWQTWHQSAEQLLALVFGDRWYRQVNART